MSRASDLEKEANKFALEALRQVGGPAAVQELARRVGVGLVEGSFDLIHQKIDWKYADPRAAAAFHAMMVTLIRRRRWYPGKWLAMYHHKRLRERWTAMCYAMGLTPVQEPEGG